MFVFSGFPSKALKLLQNSKGEKYWNLLSQRQAKRILSWLLMSEDISFFSNFSLSIFSLNTSQWKICCTMEFK